MRLSAIPRVIKTTPQSVLVHMLRLHLHSSSSESVVIKERAPLLISGTCESIFCVGDVYTCQHGQMEEDGEGDGRRKNRHQEQLHRLEENQQPSFPPKQHPPMEYKVAVGSCREKSPKAPAHLEVTQSLSDSKKKKKRRGGPTK
ncbi:unnamed protein product [Pleuronectes platessa]|uniref:Uncharacterized protein n=1 Tax=Pleuronectes platessa TaxID=8262 RepID=A0A9N7YA52_PLEPL|nr:unnamed protein product [Pleuronectes platessa]